MTILGRSRIGMKVVDVDASGGQGVQVSIPGGNPVGNASLVTSFGAEQTENFAVSQCLNGGIFLYAYGHDPQRSQFNLGVTSFLNTCSGSMGADLAGAIAAYNAGRLSKSKALSTLTVGQGSFNGYLTGQSIEVADSEIGIVVATYTFIALDAQGD